MAMFRMATLFSALLVAFVKHADGVRSPSRPEAMLEREEITSWADSCAKFGANTFHVYFWCECPKGRPMPSKECGSTTGSRRFFLTHLSKGCECLTEAENIAGRHVPVAASALRFCDALVEQSYRAAEKSYKDSRLPTFIGIPSIIEDTLQKASPKICQHALVGTITPKEAKEARFAEEASKLSQHGSDEDGDEDHRYGRMRAVKESATKPEEKTLWKDAFAQVCKDECNDLLKMMKEKAGILTQDVLHQVSFAETCAKHVVQKVEGEILGCCGRSCGFNGQTCLLWPFFSEEEKVDWEVECCAEMSILKNSSRELMCNSVLPDRLAKKTSQYDLEEQSGTDVGKVLIGQNTSLFWTKKGAQKFGTHAGSKVSIKFLLEHKNLGEEFLRHGYVREEPFSKIFDGGASSLLEVNLQDDTCNFGKLQQQCPQNFHETYMKTCKKSWKITQVSEDSEETNFRDLAFGPEEGNCDESNSQSFATPEECESLTTNSFGEIILHYFTYDTENKEKPIKCFTLSKQQCKGKDQWWTMIPLVSVQELVNEEDVNTYTELVYVWVKAD